MLRGVAWVGCGRRGSCARSKGPGHNTRATRCAGPAPVPPSPAQRRSSRATWLCRRAGAGVARATPRAASMCGDPPVWASIKSRTSNFGLWCECNWAIGAAGSALPSHGRGRGFKSRIAHREYTKSPEKSRLFVVKSPDSRRPQAATLTTATWARRAFAACSTRLEPY